MAETVTMPKLGFDMSEGTLVRWVVQEGETVEKGAVLAEIETDKATVEVESNFSGVVAKHLVEAGAVVPVNDPIAIIAAPGEKVEAVERSSVQPAAEKALPSVSTSVAAPSPKVPNASPSGKEQVGDGKLPGGVRASPLARRMAAEMHINLQQVSGSGPEGRITKQDVKAFLMSSAKDLAQATTPAAPAAAAPQPSIPVKALPPLPALPTEPSPPDETVTPSRLRLAIGRRMVESKQQVPHFYLTHEYDVAALIDIRKQLNEMLPDGQKISINDFIVKATAVNLRQYPNLNAALKDGNVVRFGEINIGVAVAVEGGLLTVVCREADRKPLRQISEEVRSMAKRARDGKVRPEEIEGSTFSISNLGMYEVENFAAIINPPEAAILAVGSARLVPVVKDGEVSIGSRMKMTISVDHRVSDGAEAARFMADLAPYIEEPARLLL